MQHILKNLYYLLPCTGSADDGLVAMAVGVGGVVVLEATGNAKALAKSGEVVTAIEGDPGIVAGPPNKSS